ncbi:bifunctional adenosylcobinamide kinase/adenosylcobinamide-phosphate guanylyltransferase [Catenovulum sp. SM1970]|uniref:bifunctional adenosylcobinamide kinase/adenosylcobinamide-phosphate guanylyltransferase n=1 Tax=Marinifaba aquimaris TaxID=2741323 RepID=UPI001571AC42|nr:bifunctional adenosylcobinamide kinase/adenosylcobinamide-phosphate guanylyltransferase [Marinifaba aquimaris]NTS77770.1 bifunctional adenosylcobinamide kinase/adenosylcobinamide-phosphate guanylyltransferase [Marinifaba aquimaris]
MISFILGGARSGKSSFAQRKAEKLASQHLDTTLTYIATATAFDSEMTDRIKRHQLDRGPEWQLIECPVDLASCLADRVQTSKTHHIDLIDCLTLWLNNQLYQAEQQALSTEQTHTYLNQAIEELVTSLKVYTENMTKAERDCHIVIISNEVGQGVIPMGNLSRLFVDYSGWLNQAIAKVADEVIFVTAGIANQLKPAANFIDD